MLKKWKTAAQVSSTIFDPSAGDHSPSLPSFPPTLPPCFAQLLPHMLNPQIYDACGQFGTYGGSLGHSAHSARFGWVPIWVWGLML